MVEVRIKGSRSNGNDHATATGQAYGQLWQPASMFSNAFMEMELLNKMKLGFRGE